MQFDGVTFSRRPPYDFQDQQTACNTAKIEADKIAHQGAYPAQRVVAVQRIEQHGDKVSFTEIMTLKIEADTQRVDLLTEVLP